MARRYRRELKPNEYIGPGGIRWDINQNEPKVTDKPANFRQAEEAAERTKKEAVEREHAEALKKRSQRLAQLASMPQGRGQKESHRVRSGGDLEESALEKAARQEAARMEGIRKQKTIAAPNSVPTTDKKARVTKLLSAMKGKRR